MAKAPKKELDIRDHHLVPLHEMVPRDDIPKVVEKIGLNPESLPKIFTTDPAIRHLDVETGDVIKIIRTSRTAGKVVTYRMVIER